MSIIRTAATIAIFNVICCIAFVVFKGLLFYDHITLHKRQYEINWISTTKPTAFHDFGAMMIFEMTGYFFGIFTNSMLVICITSAKYKNAFFFFRIYYIASIWLSIVTMIQGVELELLPYAVFSIVNLIFLFTIAVIQRRLAQEMNESYQFHVVE
ncbi:hypothetical protein PVAND_017529 [Polypedilum vanderplanki]|uniref:Uncharacterized protein n=1 Tax=Polypedilum vanderplanki TaxID=319348 RepID=A0A9J6BIJ9_POLVA|nr:hypothetical protein PVAND_017529 [Polypedilum vanderplanki]